MDIDMLVCKDEAARSVQSGGYVAGDVAAGATGVGIPIAVHYERKREREVFKTCMNTKGYEVTRNW